MSDQCCPRGYETCPFEILRKLGEQPGGVTLASTDDGYECVRISEFAAVGIHGKGKTPEEAIEAALE